MPRALESYEDLLGVLVDAIGDEVSVQVYGSSLGLPIIEFSGPLIAGDDISDAGEEEVLLLYVGTGQSRGHVMLSEKRFGSATWQGENRIALQLDATTILIDLGADSLTG